MRRARVLALGVAAVAAGGSLAPVAGAEPTAPDMPATIAVEAGHKVFLVGHAEGVQIWSCNAPAAATCNLASAGDVEEVPHTADYYFWKAEDA